MTRDYTPGSARRRTDTPAVVALIDGKLDCLYFCHGEGGAVDRYIQAQKAAMSEPTADTRREAIHRMAAWACCEPSADVRAFVAGLVLASRTELASEADAVRLGWAMALETVEAELTKIRARTRSVAITFESVAHRLAALAAAGPAAGYR